MSKSGVLLVAAIVTTGSILGFYIGHVRSPNLDSPDFADYLLFKSGTWTHIDEQHGELTLTAGKHKYTYSTGDPKVSDQTLFEKEANNGMPRNGISADEFDKIMSSVVPSSVGLIAIFGNTEGQWSVVERVVVSVATLGSIYLGYWLAHKSLKKTKYDDSKDFAKNIRDVSVWQQQEAHWRCIFNDTVSRHLGEGGLVHTDSSGCSNVSTQELNDAWSLHPEIFEQAAAADLVIGYYQEATPLLEKFAATRPNDLNGHLLLSVAYSEIGRNHDAQMQAATIMRLNSQFTVDPTNLNGFWVTDAPTGQRWAADLHKAGSK
jgi:hypothetical protein